MSSRIMFVLGEAILAAIFGITLLVDRANVVRLGSMSVNYFGKPAIETLFLNKFFSMSAGICAWMLSIYLLIKSRRRGLVVGGLLATFAGGVASAEFATRLEAWSMDASPSLAYVLALSVTVLLAATLPALILDLLTIALRRCVARR